MLFKISIIKKKSPGIQPHSLLENSLVPDPPTDNLTSIPKIESIFLKHTRSKLSVLWIARYEISVSVVILHVNFKGPPQWCSLIVHVIGLSVSPYVQYIFFPLAQFSLLITFIHRVPMVTGCLVNLNLFQGLGEIFV